MAKYAIIYLLHINSLRLAIPQIDRNNSTIQFIIYE